MALPFQGAVAATMFACAQHEPALAVAQTPGNAHRGHCAGHGDHHAGAQTAQLADASSAGADGADGTDNSAEGHQASASKCSVCASCFAAAGLPVTALSIAQQAASGPRYPSFVSQAVVFMTDGLERPPRTSLA